MSPIHKTDDYNFAQPSRTGHAGFESFKEEGDGRFYFHFNDLGGVALLFSQAYRRETDRDKGIQSVIKNAVVETQFERHTAEGGCFFILRAANGQEIARSRVFASLIELEEKRIFLSQNWALLADNPISAKATLVEVPATSSSVVTKQRFDVSPKVKPSSVILTTSSAAENVALKNKIGILEAQLAALQSSTPATKDLSDDPLRQVFRIEIYKGTHADRLHGQIIHPFSEETKAFSGFDSDTILGFMSAKLSLDLTTETPTNLVTKTTLDKAAETVPKTIAELPVHQTAPPEEKSGQVPQYLTPLPKVEPAPIKPLPAIVLAKSPVKVINLSNASAKPRPNQPFALVLSAFPQSVMV